MPAPGPLAEALAAGPVLLDGGLSNQLADAGHDLSDALWSARLLADAPGAIADAHRAYLDAGARVLTTASYQATFSGFARRGLDRRGAAELLRRSVHLARDVVGDRLSFTIDGPRTRAGQPLQEAFAVAAGRGTVLAVGVNCCRPADVGPAVEVAARVTGKPVVAYPNSGERWDAAARAWVDPDPDVPAPEPPGAGWAVADWVAAGARLVGGCCRVGPDGIAAIGRQLAAG